MKENLHQFNIVPENCRIQEDEFWHCYKNDIRGKYARSLFIFGYGEFKRSASLKNIDLLEDLVRRLDNDESPAEIKELEKFHFCYLSDCIKICLCFENYFKYKLLTNGYSIHVVDSNTRYKDLDLNKPVKIKELLRLNKFDENDIQERIPKMKKITYALSVMLDNNNDFNKVTKMPSEFLPFLSDINEIRNKLHNCYEVTIKYSMNRVDIIRRMDKFLQSELNEEMNKFSI